MSSFFYRSELLRRSARLMSIFGTLGCLGACRASSNTEQAAPEAWEVKEDAEAIELGRVGENALPNSAASPSSDLSDQPLVADELSWPESNWTFVLHKKEEGILLEELHARDPHFRRGKRSLPLNVGLIFLPDLPERAHYEKLSVLAEGGPVFVGTTLIEHDGQRHLYQCDESTGNMIYMRPEGHIECHRPGSLWWRFEMFEDQGRRPQVSNPCSGLLREGPPLLEPWADRYAQAYGAPKGEEVQGFSYQEVAYFSSKGARVSTTILTRKADARSGLTACWPSGSLYLSDDFTLEFYE